MDDIRAQLGCTGQCSHLPEFALKMAFQPIVDIEKRRIQGYEALVRGPNGESAASVLAQVNDQNRYAFDQACRVKAIQSAAQFGLDRRLSINFMPNAVYHAEACLQLTLDAARENNFPIDLITFEFTEDEQIVDRGHLHSIVTAYRRHGFRTAIDDFGAGYAGLSLLADFQPDIVKIDRVLVDGIDKSTARRAIVTGLLHTLQALNVSVVAEGVERPEELAVLKDMGVRFFQGFFFARPTMDRLIRDEEISDWG